MPFTVLQLVNKDIIIVIIIKCKEIATIFNILSLRTIFAKDMKNNGLKTFPNILDISNDITDIPPLPRYVRIPLQLLLLFLLIKMFFMKCPRFPMID